MERVQVVLKSEGRPLGADVELWQGPDSAPERIRVHTEDGSLHPFNAVIETPRGPNTIAVRNTHHQEFPIEACVVTNAVDNGSFGVLDLALKSIPKVIEGGALSTFPIAPNVESVQVLLMTDGRPLHAEIELFQGPENGKQVIELHTEDGHDRPFFAVIECPGNGNTLRVLNTAHMECPLSAWIEPYNFQNLDSEPIIGGTSAFMTDDMQLSREW